MSKTIIISGFPGVGKSYLARQSKVDTQLPNCYDCESSDYQWKKDPLGIAGPTRIENWVEKYVDAIINLKNFGTDGIGIFDAKIYDYILISSHWEVRQELQKRKVDYLVVYPAGGLRNKYMARYLERGSSLAFMKSMYDTWGHKIHSMAEDPMPQIILEDGQYLIDLFTGGCSNQVAVCRGTH